MSAPRRNRPAPRGPGLNGNGRVRRDPRVDRENQEPQPQTETPNRIRRDPRAQRAVGLLAPGQRLRIDRSRPMTLVDAGVESPQMPAASSQPVVIEQPACWILAVPDIEDGRLSPHDRDALGAARCLADALDGGVVAIAFESTGDLGAAGADRVMRFDYPGHQGFAELRAAAVLTAIENLKPRHVVFPDSLAGGGDLGRRVAASLGELPATHVARIDDGRIASRGDCGRSEFVYETPRLLLVDPGIDGPAVETLREGRALDAPACGIGSRITDLGLLPVDTNSVPLAEAELILSAGAGVTDWERFHLLATALGAAEGGSRVVCDAGNLPRERQVGASGTLVSPRCYLGLGISGAPQHLQGIARADKVIAVNIDPHAEIMKRADLAVVGDAQAIMDALLRLLKTGMRDVA